MLQFSQIVEQLRGALEPAGFDLVQPGTVGKYNARVPPDFRLDDWGAPDHLVIIVGNTRALWPAFLSALAQDGALCADPHPLNRYTERVLRAAADALPTPSEIRWAHDGAKRVAMQALAESTGLAVRSASHLSIHPVYGPWIGLRAALSAPVCGPQDDPPSVEPCAGCSVACRAAFQRALAATDPRLSAAAVESQWQLWVACRDACAVGQQYRYSDGQIRYHYTKDRQDLLKQVTAHRLRA
jgi:hypothetical protein